MWAPGDAEEIFNDKGDGLHTQKSKHSSASHQRASLAGKYQAMKPSEEDTKNKNKNKFNYKLTCHLHGAGHDMNFFKVIQVQAKSMKATWLYTCGGGGCGNFVGAKNRLAKGENLNTPVALSMSKAKERKKRSKIQEGVFWIKWGGGAL